jgi:FkbM family methyltransferase
MRVTNEPFVFGGTGEHIETELWRFLSARKDVRTVFDIGARGSTFPDIFCRHPDRRVYLFEPLHHEPLTRQYGGRPDVVVCPYGVGTRDELLPYFPNTESYVKRTVHVQSADPLPLSVRSFDSIMREFELDSVDFVKIDTEGYEFTILKAAKEYIDSQRIRFVQFEIGGTIFDINENLYDIFALFPENWRMYNMPRSGVLSRLSSAFTWSPREWKDGNLFATCLSEAELGLSES